MIKYCNICFEKKVILVRLLIKGQVFSKLLEMDTFSHFSSISLQNHVIWAFPYQCDGFVNLGRLIEQFSQINPKLIVTILKFIYTFFGKIYGFLCVPNFIFEYSIFRHIPTTDQNFKQKTYLDFSCELFNYGPAILKYRFVGYKIGKKEK